MWIVQLVRAGPKSSFPFHAFLLFLACESLTTWPRGSPDSRHLDLADVSIYYLEPSAPSSRSNTRDRLKTSLTARIAQLGVNRSSCQEPYRD
jgi:hypothetical protein